MPTFHCHACGTSNAVAEPVPRDAECSSCRRDLRCCRNCRHYDPAFNNQCRETEAEPVEDKARRNFCEFLVARATDESRPDASSRQASAREGLERMFGGTQGAGSPRPPAGPAGPAGSDRAAEARKALDRLFGGPPREGTPRPPDDADA